ncbi:hypothetical protein Pla175_16930 [Pirellulimonas nuda]|uniref:DUF3500 domain-containing protein n=1 Tax=Pirellulimonas nuda TaxID=2528009 RepID=A0A518DA45_9BACT|nr:DUF3500 domain-containing protein [Pirellulimonas nuda]QDU88318.1 hypothetical protein Pla175_16930 [Pirellulimonas nuda]
MAQQQPLGFDRRDFLRTAGGAALGAGMGAGFGVLPAGRVWAAPKQAATVAAPETLVKTLFQSLSPEQAAKVCFPWGHVAKGRGLLRTRVSANWQITEPSLFEDFYTDDQRHTVRKIMEGIYSPEWIERIDKQFDEDSGGWEQNSIAIFGDPKSDQFEFVMTGRHLTVRCDGNTTEHVAFGGPIFYGHAADTDTEGPDHPGNVYWSQGVAANALYQMLDGKQRDMALVHTGLPAEQKIAFRGERGGFQGMPVAECSADQKAALQGVLKKLVEPYREVDRQEVTACLEAQGGLDRCHLAFYQEGDIGADKVWDNWRLEGPAFVWHYRGAPHVHVWVNVADSPGVELNA